MADILTEFRAYLANEGIVRVPADAGVAPPLWLEPRKGTPAPGEGENATERGPDVVIGAFRDGGVPPRAYESEIRTDFIDLRIRTRTAKLVTDVEQQLRAALADKRNWAMGSITVIESMIFRELQPLGSDEQSFDWAMEFVFQRWAEHP